MSEYGNHLPYLMSALGKTTGDVVEMGCGDGSTLQLHEYCEKYKRKLFSYDSKQEWLNKFLWLQNENHKIELANWDEVVLKHQDAGLIFIDHAPGERRSPDCIALKNINGILVCHDTEPQPTMADYKWEEAFAHFKYRKDFPNPNKKEGGWNEAWTTIVSNTINL